ncbi:MAG: DUF3109 family protein [Myxococcota bacterium]
MSLRRSVDRWMIEAYQEPWRAYVARKQTRGDLVRVKDVWVDAPNVIDRVFRCDPAVCSPGLRRRGQESCCAEFQVELTTREVRVLERHFSGISRFLAAHDAGWAHKNPTLQDVITEGSDNPFVQVLGKRNRRCAFSFLDERGAIQCGVHGYALAEGLDVFEVKPKLCFLFPLLVQDLQDGTWLITVIDDENSDLVGFTSYDNLPCLWGEKTFGRKAPVAPPFYDDHRSTLVHLFGAPFMRALDELARDRGRVPAGSTASSSLIPLRRGARRRPKGA